MKATTEPAATLSPTPVRAPEPSAPFRDRAWSLLSNHGLVFVVIAADPELRVRDIADRVGITERAAHRILSDLCEEGFVTRHRVGRRTVYHIHSDSHFRHPWLRSEEIGSLLRIAEAMRPR